MTIYDELFDLLSGHKYSNYFYCCCPHHEHNDTRPSMAVWEDEDKPEGDGRFKCSGCGFHGTHKYLLNYITGGKAYIKTERKEQVFLPQWSNWNKYYGNLENLVEHANSNVRHRPDLYGHYFAKRQLSSMVDVLRLGMIDSWAMFPIFDMTGNIIDVICRNTLKFGNSKYVIRPDTSRETTYLYVPNWKRILSSTKVYVVYGIIDAISLEMAELPVVTGSTGKSLSYKSLIPLNKIWSIIPDKGEELEARNLAKEIGNFTRVLYMPYCEQEKDCDDLRTKRSLEEMKSLITGE